MYFMCAENVPVREFGLLLSPWGIGILVRN